MTLCFGLSISNQGSTMEAQSSLSLHGCQRSWHCLRLVTEQGKQLALNSGRIASLYSVEGTSLGTYLVFSGSRHHTFLFPYLIIICLFNFLKSILASLLRILLHASTLLKIFDSLKNFLFLILNFNKSFIFITWPIIAWLYI